MKKIICFLLISLSIYNCKSQKKDSNSITTIELRQLLKVEKIQLLDVRTPKEIQQGSIKGAIKVNFFDKNFKEQVKEKLDKSKPIYIYCRSGNRSGKSCNLLKEEGYEVINVLGGYSKWINEN